MAVGADYPEFANWLIERGWEIVEHDPFYDVCLRRGIHHIRVSWERVGFCEYPFDKWSASHREPTPYEGDFLEFLKSGILKALENGPASVFTPLEEFERIAAEARKLRDI